MKIYLSGASAEHDLCADYMARLRCAGFDVAVDWCADVRAHGVGNPTDQELAATLAKRDLAGIPTAAVFWLLVPDAKSIGCWIECGYALAHGIHIIVSGDWEATIFSSLATHRFGDHESAFGHIVSFGGEA